MQITVEISDKVESRAASIGMTVESFVREVAERAAETAPLTEWDRIPPGPYTPAEAARNMRELSNALSLGGIKI